MKKLDLIIKPYRSAPFRTSTPWGFPRSASELLNRSSETKPVPEDVPQQISCRRPGLGADVCLLLISQSSSTSAAPQGAGRRVEPAFPAEPGLRLPYMAVGLWRERKDAERHICKYLWGLWVMHAAGRRCSSLFLPLDLQTQQNYCCYWTLWSINPCLGSLWR